MRVAGRSATRAFGATHRPFIQCLGQRRVPSGIVHGLPGFVAHQHCELPTSQHGRQSGRKFLDRFRPTFNQNWPQKPTLDRRGSSCSAPVGTKTQPTDQFQCHFVSPTNAHRRSICRLPVCVQHINFCGCACLATRASRAVCIGCPNLQHVNLCGCQAVSDEGLRALLTSCPSLQTYLL